MKLTRFVSVLCLISASLSALGQEAPPLQVSQWMQAPSGFSGRWSDLRGKVVVLEFWATWCSPCIYAIPHLNQLAMDFKGQDVVFLAVTDDDADRLSTFLAKQPMGAIIGIDVERRNWKPFGVDSIPRTVLIGKDGTVIGATLPENVTAEVLREAQAGKRPALPAIQGLESDFEWDDHSVAWQDGVAPAMYAIIKPIKTTTSGFWVRPGHITADGATLEVLMQIAYQTDHYHIDWRLGPDEQTYRAAFRVPEERRQQMLPYMQQTLADMFAVHARWETQERKVFVLRRIRGHAALPASRADKDLVQMMRGTITLHRQPFAKLCNMLTNSLHEVVVDETGLVGRYDFHIPYQPGRPEVTAQALKSIGLELLPARRRLRILVVEAKKVVRTTDPGLLPDD